MLQLRLQKQRGDFSLDLAVNAPQGVIALFGRSGCGKSTVVNLLAGLLRPDAGRIQLDDEVLFDAQLGIDLPAEQRRIGYVFQDARLFPHYTVLGNLRYGQRRASGVVPGITFDKIVQLLALETLLQRRPAQLSGGERQRVAIGRALLSQPRLLLLDEPLASLDQARREEVLPYLQRLRDELTIPMVYVSHQFEEVLRLASYVVLMDRGRALAQDELSALSLRPECRAVLAADAIGAVVEGSIGTIDTDGLAQVRLGDGQLHVDGRGFRTGERVRLQLLARDLILATEAPRGLSVRSSLQGVITRLTPDEPQAVLVEINAGGVSLLARVTTGAAVELALRPGLPVWVLVKAVTLRGRVFQAPAA